MNKTIDTRTLALANSAMLQKVAATDAVVAGHTSQLAAKANSSDMTTALAAKANQSYVDKYLVTSGNLFNKETATSGKYLNVNYGTLTTDVNFFSSDFIDVSSLSNWTVPCRQCVFYTSAKLYISGNSYAAESVNTISKPANCVYVRFSNTLSHLSTTMFNAGSTALPYADFGEYVNPDKISRITMSKVITEKGNMLTLVEGIQSDIADINTDISVTDVINLPDTIYGLVGKEINIYFDNLMYADYKKYDINTTCSIGKQEDTRWTCTPDDAGTYEFVLDVLYNGSMVATKTIDIVVTASTVGDAVTKTVLVIGDSTTAIGTVTGELVTLFGADVMDITLLGTIGTAPNLHEGRGGWTLQNYLEDAEISGVTNPFYNSGFDFGYYMTQQSYASVDYVIINLGINDVFGYLGDTTLLAGISSILARYTTIINSIKAFNSGIKIGVALTIPPAYSQDGFGNSYDCGQTRWRYKRNNIMLVQAVIDEFSGMEAQGVYLVPINVNLDTQNNMPSETVAVNGRNATTVVRQTNGVHPATSGYYQIADIYYYWLKSFET